MNSAIIRKTRPLVIRVHHPDRWRNWSIAAELAIVQQARDFGWDLLDLQFTNNALPQDRMPDGAIVGLLPDDPFVTKLVDLRCPSVRLGRRPHPADRLLPVVLPDLDVVGRLAAEHFAERQFRHVAFIGHDPWHYEGEPPHYSAFQKRARELGCKCHLYRFRDEAGINTKAKHERRRVQLHAWFDEIPKPFGILAYSDLFGATLCAICQQSGFSVPEDIAILGMGNNELYCEMSPVTLSSIDMSEEAYGRQAALLLRRMMHGEKPPDRPVWIAPKKIVTRQSTDVLAVSNPVVAQAMRFMWDHLEQDLSVENVAHEVGLSRRKLERDFHKYLGRGIHAELRRKRLERCCELLRTTPLTIADLAPKVGFRSADFLHATFKKEFGITPRQYRMRTK